MNLTALSNKQLYRLKQNEGLLLELRNIASEEFSSRNLETFEMDELVYNHRLMIQNKNEPLETKYKVLIILFPFLMPIQSLFAARWLGQGYKRKWKNYWFCILTGYFIWTILFVISSRVYFQMIYNH